MATAPLAAKPGAFGSLVTVALVLVLAWQLAHWTWVFVSPGPKAQASEGASVDMRAIARMFGGDAAGAGGGAGSSPRPRFKGGIAPPPGGAAAAVLSPRPGR